ncbi:MAG: hypothetical protein OSJ58_00735 [Dysosmobacter sp.]|nr:hypothetical protein [Dysosmobacter sp.]
MRRFLLLTLTLLLFSACAAPEKTSSPPLQETPAEEFPKEAGAASEEKAPAEELEDHVILTLDAPLADGRTLTLEAVGKQVDEYSIGVREVRVYDGEELLQTVLAREANGAFWGDSDLLPGESVNEYTQCWSAEDSMAAADMNFDGNTDLGLFAFTPNNTIPFYFWIWDAETEQYRYAFTLQGATAHPDAREVTAEYKSGSAGSQWITEVYKPDENGDLYLDRVERDTCDFAPEPPGYLDFDRGWAKETWTPAQEAEPIRPDEGHGILEQDFILIYRYVPVYEDNGDGTVSHFTEIWELRDGKFQMTSREEYFYEQ